MGRVTYAETYGEWRSVDSRPQGCPWLSEIQRICLAIFGVLCLFLNESFIGFISIPVIIVLFIGTVLANQKANAAITQ